MASRLAFKFLYECAKLFSSKTGYKHELRLKCWHILSFGNLDCQRQNTFCICMHFGIACTIWQCHIARIPNKNSTLYRTIKVLRNLIRWKNGSALWVTWEFGVAVKAALACVTLCWNGFSSVVWISHDYIFAYDLFQLNVSKRVVRQLNKIYSERDTSLFIKCDSVLWCEPLLTYDSISNTILLSWQNWFIEAERYQKFHLLWFGLCMYNLIFLQNEWIRTNSTSPMMMRVVWWMDYF